MSLPDFSRHNEEVKKVWDAYRAGRPVRVPLLLTANTRTWLLDPALNRAGISWKAFVSDPELMFETQLKFREYLAFHIPQDVEMGLPAQGWSVFVEFHNVVEEAWLGSPLRYPENQVSVSVPAFAGERKWAVFERGFPGPFDDIFGRMREFYEHFQEKARSFEYLGRPISVLPPTALGTDGPLTIANGVRGPEIFEDLLNDEAYYHRLMDFITEATIRRIRAWREALHLDPRPRNGFFADDAVQFLSLQTYREKVLPYHHRLLAELFGEGPHAMHLCGNVQRHLPVIAWELNVNSFDTGFPIRWETLRDEVGEGVEILGGVTVMDLLACRPAEIRAKARQILESGIKRGGRFILKEANNLAPCTPPENIAAMYEAVKMWGRYSAHP
jgi:uroporphyrinogen-III decarboxylase